ncbi:hypothetical protein LJC38_08020 [Parabacteroides sp. OttesenSCG-928-K15]|nr:hypothetical protein [Parabacteroides sp. OttesenSCG-928-K15]
MKKSIYPLFFFCFVFPYVCASDYLRMPDMRSMAMGGNTVTQSSFFNPSLLSLQTNRSIYMQYFNRFQLKELGSITGCFTYPNRLLPIGFYFSSFGYDAYRQTMFRFAAGKQLGNHWHLGIAFQYLTLQTELFEESPAALSTDLGCVYQPFDNLLIGLFIMHLPVVHLKDKNIDNKVFTNNFFSIGLEWEFINNLLITLSSSYRNSGSFGFHGGLEYSLFHAFHLRCGVQGKPFSPTFGIGYDFSSFSLDIAAVGHATLGLSTGIGISFHF